MKGAPGVLRVSFEESMAIVEIESDGRQVRAELSKGDFCELLTVLWREEFLNDVHK